MFEKSLSFPGTQEYWNGYALYRFMLDDLECLVVVPSAPIEGRYWLWRARFFNAFPNFDLDMVRHGFYLAHVNITPFGGGEKAMQAMTKFYNFLTSEYGFNSKAVMEGYSRGALSAFNWSIRNPDKIYCLYADNPICNYRSWPHRESDRQQCRKAGVMDENNNVVPAWNPVDNLAPLAEHKVPLYLVCAEEDELVRPDQNALLVQKLYRKMGGTAEVRIKSGAHQPHCLDNPDRIVSFALAAAGIEQPE